MRKRSPHRRRGEMAKEICLCILTFFALAFKQALFLIACFRGRRVSFARFDLCVPIRLASRSNCLAQCHHVNPTAFSSLCLHPTLAWPRPCGTHESGRFIISHFSGTPLPITSSRHCARAHTTKLNYIIC